MSMFSGKCDCYDTLVVIHNYTEIDLKNKVEIYVGNNTEPLHIDSYKDLIPYYPHLISSAMFSKGKSVVHLSSESFVDSEERESMEFRLKELIKIYNRCKRKKIDFNINDSVKEICYGDWNKDIICALAKRVKENGKKATIDGLHLKLHEMYRKELVDVMVENNLDPREYGYDRFMEDKYI